MMQALWAEPHVTFEGRWHKIEDAGINPRPASGGCRYGSAAIMNAHWSASPKLATAGCRTRTRRARRPPTYWTSCAR